MKFSRIARPYGLRTRQHGQGMTEYIIITALIAIAAIAAVTYFGQTTRSQVAGMANELAGKNSQSDIDSAAQAAGKARGEDKQKTLDSYKNSTAH
ncbi:pilus assembly protein [Halothiobacillus diazotrophicus]|uniref:Pilus assembly protein n=1 Tax=Halothiobacillus diazotrophicus TaxID=1860122 RepID=A0A191ZGM0_9GAMM|nr:pilus assembly protein [Halothiobacillus diazotrophicus]ANJ67005.1 pilus assembly protein [Halothiobacillus diazotrophicus]